LHELFFACIDVSNPACKLFNVAATLAGEGEYRTAFADSNPEVFTKLILVAE
jgi:hypothetical protein